MRVPLGPSIRGARRASFAAAALGLVVALAACRAQRELVITSDPPGATIRLDDYLIGSKTPAHIPFKDYGVRRVTLYLDGYVTYSQSFHVKPPWYGYFPLDVFSEIVFPVGWRDRHKLKVKLVKGDTLFEAPDVIGVIQRAEALRRQGPSGRKPEKKPVQELPRDTSPAQPAADTSPDAPTPRPPSEKPGGGGA